jgi:hypothetical protein
MDDIDDLKRLAGVGNSPGSSVGATMTARSTALAQYQREHKIRPGTPEWFKLWFSKPQLTGESPFGDKP